MTYQEVYWRNYPEERPSENNGYITTCLFGKDNHVVQQLRYINGYFVTFNEDGIPNRSVDKNVIAWMPLPIPAHRKDKENELPKV